MLAKMGRVSLGGGTRREDGWANVDGKLVAKTRFIITLFSFYSLCAKQKKGYLIFDEIHFDTVLFGIPA